MNEDVLTVFHGAGVELIIRRGKGTPNIVIDPTRIRLESNQTAGGTVYALNAVWVVI